MSKHQRLILRAQAKEITSPSEYLPETIPNSDKITFICYLQHYAQPQSFHSLLERDGELAIWSAFISAE